MAVALAVPGWGMGEPRDVMVFFATDDALEQTHLCLLTYSMVSISFIFILLYDDILAKLTNNFNIFVIKSL